MSIRTSLDLIKHGLYHFPRDDYPALNTFIWCGLVLDSEPEQHKDRIQEAKHINISVCHLLQSIKGLRYN